ncbi:MAG TPA: alpha/beta fold hydrolase [Nitrospiraceae bacterium]|nr:alpha/beta fold hydrolase [Nitrospiraceae bacterium]
MSSLHSFELAAPDGKLIRGDRSIGRDRQILFITGFLSKRWGNKSKVLAQWCEEKGWGFCCYDVRGFGDSGGTFTDYTLSDWNADARLVLNMLQDGQHLTHPSQALSHPPAPSLSNQAPFPRDAPFTPITIVGNSFGGWIAWMMAQECSAVEKLILIAPAFDAIGVRAREISADRRNRWHDTGWMPWDDDPVHKDWPLSWKWVEESEAYWSRRFDQVRRVKTTLLHGLQDRTIHPRTSWQFVDELLVRDPDYPIELTLKMGDHRLSGPEHLDTFRRLVLDPG